MNAAAKELSQSNFFSGQIKNVRVSKQTFLQLFLLILVLLSALAVVYVTNLQRVTFAQLQVEEQQTNHLQLQWGQLLLEQASLATPSRVEKLATQKLHMVLPAANHTFILRAR